MSGPNETPLNVRKLRDTSDIFEVVKELYEHLVGLQATGEIHGSITHFGSSFPPTELGDDGDIYLREVFVAGQSPSHEVWAKKNGVWIIIGKNAVPQ